MAVEFVGTPYGEGPKGAWAFLVLSKAASKSLGTKGRAPIRVTVNGAQTFRMSAFPDGKGGNMINFNKQMQAATGVLPGMGARFRVELDVEERAVTLPKDLKTALEKAPRAKAAFDGLAPSHKKGYVYWIEEAKRPETRKKRVHKAVDRLAKGEKFWD